MTRQYLLDTNTFIYAIKGIPSSVRDRLRDLPQDEPVCISVITEAELLYGLAKSNVSDSRRHAIMSLLGRLRILPWESLQARTYAKLRADLERNGRPLGPLDTQIAAHALSLGATLVTSDKALLQTSDLVTEDWAESLHI